MLKRIKLQAELQRAKNGLAPLANKKTDFDKRKSELEAALVEAATEEDIAVVEGQISELETEINGQDVDAEISRLNAEIVRIEKEIAELDEKAQAGAEKTGETKTEERVTKNMNRMQIRELLKTGAYYERAEVKEFYEKFKTLGATLRAVGGEGLTIPQIIVNRILDIVGDYSTLYPLVNKIKVSGTTRILIDTDTTAATWMEQTGAISTGNVGTITNVDFDGWKVGKITFVDNSILQDSIINLDDYVTKKIARAIGLAIDLAIPSGTGAAGKQPTGIIPSLAAEHKVTVTDPKGYADIVKPIALIDSGADNVGEIIAVMKRATYYNRCLEYSVQSNSSGQVVGKLPNLNSPDLLGLRVVFNNNIEADKILFGEFDKYTLVERESITIDQSEHIKFVEDQTAFRGKGRFDGKPTNADAFVLVTLAYTPVG